MSESRITLTLWNAQQGYQELLRAWAWAKAMLTAGHRLTLVLRKETRSAKQNNLMWSCLTDLSNQVEWYGKKFSPKGWKSFITAHLDGQELVPNMEGRGFVAINEGSSTSDMTIAEMTAVIDLCHAFGADKDVQWSPTSLGVEQ